MSNAPRALLPACGYAHGVVATAAPPRRQRRVKLKSNSSTVGEYRYDALGRRVEKVVTGATYRYIYSDVETVSVYTSTVSVL